MRHPSRRLSPLVGAVVAGSVVAILVAGSLSARGDRRADPAEEMRAAVSYFDELDEDGANGSDSTGPCCACCSNAGFTS